MDVQQHAVAGDAGGQHPVQQLDGLAGEVHGGLLGAQQRPAMEAGALQALREAVQLPGDDQGRDVIQEEIVKTLPAHLLRQALEVHDLRLADHLEAHGIKIVVKSLELQAGSVHIRNRQPCGIVIPALVQNLQMG